MSTNMEWGSFGMVAVALGVVAWLALHGSAEAAGALIGVVSAGTGFFLRGRVEAPTPARPPSV